MTAPPAARRACFSRDEGLQLVVSTYGKEAEDDDGKNRRGPRCHSAWLAPLLWVGGAPMNGGAGQSPPRRASARTGVFR